MNETSCDVSNRIPLRPGDVVASTYGVQRVLGAGAMGAVVAAIDLRTGDRVAIKCLLPEHARDEPLVRRFEREALVGMRLRSQHAVRILGMGTLEPPRPGSLRLPYMVMEHLRGVDLGVVLRGEGPLDPAVAADYVAHACDALAEMHALGFVHRDVKPANLFVTTAPDGRSRVKLLDFGVARVIDPGAVGGEVLTAQGTAVGTPSYMAPEQISDSTNVDPRADIWALGVTLYRMLAGVMPFKGDTPVELALSIFQDEPPPLSAVRADVPAGLERVVRRCLAKQRQDRYPSAKILGAAAEMFASGLNRWAWTDSAPGRQAYRVPGLWLWPKPRRPDQQRLGVQLDS